MKVKVLGLIFFTIVLSSCDDLDVENLNDPDFARVLSGPDQIRDLAGDLIHSWFQITQGYSSLGLPLEVAADAGTGSWGNTRDFGREPRTEFNNHSSYPNSYQTVNYYKALYLTLADANDVLSVIDNEGKDIDSSTKEIIRAVAYFAQGLSLGYLGLIYDKAFIVTHETDLSYRLETSSYKEIILSAVTSLDRVIDISSNNTFAIPDTWLPGDSWSSVEFARLASSFAARLLVYSARNKTDDNATDWAKVYAYAKNGIQKDFAPLGNPTQWYSEYHLYSIYATWLQTDMYVVNLMDPNMPAHFPANGDWSELPDGGRATSADARLESDYQYVSFCSFKPERGYYFFSSYRYKRLDPYASTTVGPMPEFRKAENDYLLAEAAVHMGKIQEAADVMNASARVTRGNLAPFRQ